MTPFEQLPETAQLLYYDLERAADTAGNLPACPKEFRRVSCYLTRRRQAYNAALVLHAARWIRFYTRSQRTYIHLPMFEPPAGRFAFRHAPDFDPKTDHPKLTAWYMQSRRGIQPAAASSFQTPPRHTANALCWTTPPRGVLYPLRVDLSAGRAELLRPTRTFKRPPFHVGAWIFARHGATAIVYHVQPAGFVKIGAAKGTNPEALAGALDTLTQGKELQIVCPPKPPSSTLRSSHSQVSSAISSSTTAAGSRA